MFKNKITHKIILLYFLIAILFTFSAKSQTSVSIQTAEQALSNGNYDKALEIWQILSKKGNLIAINNLGFMYERGYGVIRNNKKAVALYKRAAEGGIAIAQFNYGEALFLGNGIKQDNIEAKKWLLIALDRGSKDALYLLKDINKLISKEENTEAKNRFVLWKNKFNNRQVN
jgi:TPR repeat protein